jgi:hypothetical protein
MAEVTYTRKPIPVPAPWRHASDVAREVLKKAAATKREKAANDG